MNYLKEEYIMKNNTVQSLININSFKTQKVMLETMLITITIITLYESNENLVTNF